MYYAITDNGIVSGKKPGEVNKKLDALIEESEYRQLGPDRVVTLTKQDLEFVQDKKRMSIIPIKNLYKKNNTLTLMLGIILLLEFILLVKG